MSDQTIGADALGPRIAKALGIGAGSAARTLELLDGGNTVPFIARYRKEATGGIDEEVIRAVAAEADRVRALEGRRLSVFGSIEEQGKMTDELRLRLAGAGSLTELEDLYLPYRKKRQTRAMKARDAGLAPLAELLSAQELSDPELRERAQAFLSADKGIESVEAALEGACDIVAEGVAEDAATRAALRDLYKGAVVEAKRARLAKADVRTYETYEGFEGRASTLKHHQVLALDRGERDGQLSVSVAVDRDAVEDTLKARHQRPGCPCPQTHGEALKQAWRRLLQPALEREVRVGLTAAAQEQAIAEFARNLKNLLLQPPVHDLRVLAIDPGIRTGCKLAALDEHGRLLEHATIFPHAPRHDLIGSAKVLVRLLREHRLNGVAIGNGTASRETEEVVANVLREVGLEIPYTIVDEAGASVYSVSTVAREEMAELDATVRGTVSIGRRLQDPLAELVKIDPRSIGVGMYQHDVDERSLARSLDGVVEDCVNYVGVDLNTASAPLLTHIAGLTARTAQAIVEHRGGQGPFKTRKALLEVAGIGPRSFEQAAGFLRVRGGPEPLDATAVHPESYEAARRVLEATGARLEPTGAHLPERLSLDRLAGELGVGLPTLEDIVRELRKPGRDPRAGLPPVVFRKDVLRMEDIEPGQWLEGTVRNVVPFGAFVDIGVKQDGLVHISQLADRYVTDPHAVIKVGDRVRARVLEIDKDRGRIALSLRTDRPSPSGAPQDRAPNRGGAPTGSKPTAAPARSPKSARAKPASRATNRSTPGRSPQSGLGQPGGWKPFADLLKRKDK